MKAALISLGSKSSLMTVEAMKKYFESVDFIYLKNLEVQLGKEASVLYNGEKLPYYDCVYLKGSFRYANLLRSITTLLEKKVAYMPLQANSFTIVHNKLLTHLSLQQHNIPMPRTYLTSGILEAKGLLKKVHYPIVMKFPEGSHGKGVMFADSESSASSLLDALEALKQPFIIQEYIETDGVDLRAFVVGEKVVALMKRKARIGENRANIHLGGKGESAQLTPEIQKVAVAAAKALGAEICGVDILETPLGPMVIEANISPGLQGIQEVSIINIADQIASYLYRKTEDVISKSKQKEAEQMIKEISVNEHGFQEIISPLLFRGDKILLPEFVNRLAKFNEQKEYSIKVKKGSVEIKDV
ncbi:RimK family alpha-L-glutamate ligase [Candidatus Woesearchaeota archaeon]|nr:RimK family alpha-L-glutamate ligase [Candidatus Woesearchaeota archaeon]